MHSSNCCSNLGKYPKLDPRRMLGVVASRNEAPPTTARDNVRYTICIACLQLVFAAQTTSCSHTLKSVQLLHAFLHYSGVAMDH